MKGSQHNDRFIKSNSTEAGAPALTTATMASALVRKTFFHVATATYDGTETVMEANIYMQKQNNHAQSYTLKIFNEMIQ